jgi:hypothetical protein
MIKWILVCLLLSSCMEVKDTITGSSIIECRNHQSRRLDFVYSPENARVWHDGVYDVDVYIITTVKGDVISLNSLELDNYDCLEKSRG